VATIWQQISYEVLLPLYRNSPAKKSLACYYKLQKSGPWNFFNDHGAAAATARSPHGAQEENEKSPQRGMNSKRR
jgi:hypothetical protein